VKAEERMRQKGRKESQQNILSSLSSSMNHGTQNTKFLKKQGPRKEEGRSYITVNIHV